MSGDGDDSVAGHLRAILARSERWAKEVGRLSMVAIAKHDPVDLTGCSAEEAFEIARWATDPSEYRMPQRLRKYLEAVKG